MKEAIGLALGVMLFLTLATGMIFLIFALVQTQKRIVVSKLQPIASALGGELVSRRLGLAYLRFPGEYEFRLRLIPKSKNHPPILVIERMAPLDFDLMISTENVLSQAFEKINLLKEVKTGDPIFDQKYLIRGKPAEQIQNFLLTGARREAVDYFFGQGFTRLGSDRQTVYAHKVRYTDQDLNPERVRNALEQMQRFVSG